jgi:hypothetical protein
MKRQYGKTFLTRSGVCINKIRPEYWQQYVRNCTYCTVPAVPIHMYMLNI